ncbi:MAG: extracellular solute-binding protein [Clostridiales bacterium]|jgi:predicted small lipoprotein YifL|nr:extracellular solute-binding protein [Clostridiales bacterium]
MKRTLAILLALAMLLSLASACGAKESPATAPPAAPAATAKTEASQAPAAPAATEEPAAPAAYYDLLDSVEDSSDLPDWTGKQLKLKAWYAHGSGEASRSTASKDVVAPEIKRITGVEIDADTSFDNGGQSVAIKLGMLNAGKDWPDIAFVSDSGMSDFKDLFEAGIAYDLTGYLDELAPNLQKRIPFDMFPEALNMATCYNLDGKIYSLPMQLGNPERSIQKLNPDFVAPNAQNGADGAPIIMIRDDILKALYPNAKSADEIEALYEQKGRFSREEIYDVPIKTKEDIIKLFYDVKALIDEKSLTENGKPVLVTYAFGGQDNWYTFGGLLPALNRITTQVNYFTYFDPAANSMKFMFQEDYFKDTTKLFNQLVRDDIMDKNSLLENNASHVEKLNNGQYAITYVESADESVLRDGGKTYRYRPIWIDSPLQTDKFLMPLSPIKTGYAAVIFKDKVKEEDLPQVIRYLDFLISEVGEKMYTWGPKSAGLFDEVDGKRIFKDKALESNMVYGEENGKSLEYNLTNNWLGSSSAMGNGWPYYPTYMWGGSDLVPFFSYERETTAADGKNFFDPGNLPGLSYNELGTPVAKDHQIWSFFGMENVDKFWNGRDAFEKALTKTMAASSDEQFEQLFAQFLDIATSNGATPEVLKEIDAEFKKANEGFLK